MTSIDRVMWQRAFELMDQVEWLRRHAFNAPAWQPLVDVFESDECFHFVVALPGVDPADIEIGLSGHVLVISGESSRPSVCTESVVRRLEIPSGRFERRIELPPGTFEFGAREHSHGCLLFKLQKHS